MRMLQQTFYSICFRREENMCEIDYSVTTAGSFQLGVGVVANAGKLFVQNLILPGKIAFFHSWHENSILKSSCVKSH